MKKYFLPLWFILVFIFGGFCGAYLLEKFNKNLINDLNASHISEALMTYEPALDFLEKDKVACAKFILASQMQMEVEISAPKALENNTHSDSYNRLMKSTKKASEFLVSHQYFSSEKEKCSR